MSKCGSGESASAVIVASPKSPTSANAHGLTDDDDMEAYGNSESFYYDEPPHLHPHQGGDSTQRLPLINQFSPRRMMTTTLRGILRKCDHGFGYDDGVKVMPGTDDPLWRSDVPPNNLVLDYKRLRKSGYFLEKPVNHRGDHYDDGSFYSSHDRMSNVAQWLSSNSSEFQLTGLDKSPEHEHIDGLKGCFVQQVLTEEGSWKCFMLGDQGLRRKLKFTSEPAQTLTYEERERILEPANGQVIKILENQHMSREQDEHGYVYGIVAFPAGWRATSKTVDDDGIAFHTGLIKRWLPKVAQGLGSKKQEEGELILEPYHGPTFINGSFIKSGYTGRSRERLSFPGRIMEEVKAALRVIHKTLQQPGKGSAPSSVMVAQSPEDAEMDQLTQLLWNTKLEKKPNLEKTAFVVATPQGRPNTSCTSRSASFRTRGTSIFSRVVRRMTERAPSRRLPTQGVSRGEERRFLYARNNRVNPVGPVSSPRPTTTSGNFSAAAALRSVVKLIAPFQIPSPVPARPYIFSPSNEDYVNPAAATST